MFISPFLGDFSYVNLTNDVGQQRHKAGAFDRLRKRALVGSTQVGAAARHDFAMRINKLFYGLDIFVIDVLYMAG